LIVPRTFPLSPTDATSLQSEIRALFTKRLAHYKQLRGGIEFVPAEGISRTGGGKVKRGEIRQEQREKAKARYAAASVTAKL
jgi:hypothetical protein